MTIDQEYFWSDSRIVLGYIYNNTKRFLIYVANRIHEITSKTNRDDWYHINLADNPADLASRGTSLKDLPDARWLYGPTFLWDLDITNYTDQGRTNHDINENDPELRKVRVMATSTDSSDFIKTLEKFSSWKRLI